MNNPRELLQRGKKEAKRTRGMRSGRSRQGENNKTGHQRNTKKKEVE
jgi:hypothetical protein